MILQYIGKLCSFPFPYALSQFREGKNGGEKKSDVSGLLDHITASRQREWVVRYGFG